jgi:hypothetical protein
MARPRKAEGGLTALKDNAISDGKGGFLVKGDKFDAVDADAAASLKAKGLAQ